MTFDILTLFPDVFESYLSSGIIARSIVGGSLKVNIINWRDYSRDKHNRVDDTVSGGGPGMLLKCDVLYDALMDIGATDKRVIFLTPGGVVFNQESAKEFALEEDIVLVCGYYEGFDARIFDLFKGDRVSIGDYVISNGSLAALVFMDVVVRLGGSLLSNVASLEEESFEGGLLEYDQYTRPISFNGLSVPDILLSGNHKKIQGHKRRSAILNTMRYRPDLLEQSVFSLSDLEIISSYFEDGS